jgi:hypothetical protein
VNVERRLQLTTGCDFYIWVTLGEGESEPEMGVDVGRRLLLSFNSIFLITNPLPVPQGMITVFFRKDTSRNGFVILHCNNLIYVLVIRAYRSLELL